MKAADIKSRLERTGKSQVALSKFLGISKDSASRLVKGDRSIKASEAERIEAFFSGDEPSEPQFIQIPVFGYAAAGSDDRIAIADDRVIDRIEVPVGLVRGDMMAIRINGDSMAPRLFSGETVIVARGLKPAKNGDCVVEFNDGTAIVKQYQGERNGVVFLFQFNPEGEVRKAATQIRAIHAVMYRR